MRINLLTVLAFVVLAGIAHAQQNAPTLDLMKNDIQSVQLELKPGGNPKLDIYFSKGKLLEAQTLINENLDTPIAIKMNGVVVATPSIKTPLVYKKSFITLRFPNVDSAVKAARLLVPAH